MRDERDQLLELARKISTSARKGAEVAEVSVGSSWDLSAKVRLGQTELVEEAGQKGASLRVIKDGRLAMSSTSDLSEAGIALLVSDALELADLAEADPLLGPADSKLLAKGPHPDLNLFDPEIDAVDAKMALEYALQGEKAALEADSKITLGEGSTFSRTTGSQALVLSSGFEGTAQGSYASLSVVPLAEEADGTKRRGSYWTARRHLSDLESPKIVGQEATRRTLQKLGAQKGTTGEAPIIFDTDVARSIISAFVGTILGGSLYRKSSYLLGRINTPVASSLLELVDDPLIIKGPGSRAYDGEGLVSRKNAIVEAGELKSYLLDCYSSRKLGLEPTASASRAGGSIGSSASNLLMSPGKVTPTQLISQTERGLLVTEMMGFGFNSITGDFSRGAAGFWVEDGKIQYPVNEVTISSNLDDMLKGIDLIANDVELKSSITAPTFRVAKMTISGS